VRGRDAAGNWGNASSLEVHVNSGTVGVEGGPAVPARFGLAQNAPNPFNPQTMIRFSLAAESEVRLFVYDVSGRVVRTLAEGRWTAGPHEVSWDGRADGGVPVASGLYFCKLSTPFESAVRKMVMLK
jgi:hypothetical protein